MLKKIIGFIVIVLVLFGLYKVLSIPPKTQNKTDSTPESNTVKIDTYKDYPVYDNPNLVFYWGIGCPHCENVEKWITENNATQKLKINFKEVYYNKDNQTGLYNIAKEFCPEIIENGGIGVPTGFDPINKKCIQGDTPIIDFLKQIIK